MSVFITPFEKENQIERELIKHFKPLFDLALLEDLGNGFNITSKHANAIGPENLNFDITTSTVYSNDNIYEKALNVSALDNHLVKTVIIAKEMLVVCGLPLMDYIFHLYGKLKIKMLCKDGDILQPGGQIAIIEGDISHILSLERIGLNILQYLSSIASKTRKWVSLISPNTYQLYDTRKTLPGYRFLAKYAVKKGGGENHRFGLYSDYLFKDNHFSSGVPILIQLQKAIDHRKYHKLKDSRLEVEVQDLKELEEVLSFDRDFPQELDIIMLDNFSHEQVKEAVKMIKSQRIDIVVELSGNINQKSIPTLNKLYQTLKTNNGFSFDMVSSGALTHQIDSVDISLEIT